jgi:prepilin-type N-terminal cleavage/methylation domain-containing protein
MMLRHGASAPREARRWTARARDASAARRRGDGGFTLVEVLIALVILGMVVPAALFITRNLNQQAANIGADVQGVQQDTTAGEALYPYLQSATAVLSDSTSTYLDAEIYFGFDQQNAIPNTAELEVTLVRPPGADPYGKQTELEATIVNPVPASQCANNQAQQCTQSRTVGTYSALYEPGAFTYEYNTPVGSTGPSGLTDPSALNTPSTTQAGSVVLSEIVKVEINITFLAGPNRPITGYSQIQASHFNTTVYLENAVGGQSKQTTLSLISPGTIIYSPGGPTESVLEAEISPEQVDVGTVSFTVFLQSMQSPVVVCANAQVLEGYAECSFNAPGYGGGTATAQYEPPPGDQEYQPSPVVQASIESFVPTSINFGTVTDAVGQHLQVPVTVSDAVTGSGAPSVPGQGDVVFEYYYCSSGTGSTSTSSSSTTSSTTPNGACSASIAAGPDTVCLPCGQGQNPPPTWTDVTFLDSGDFPDLPTVPVEGSWIEVLASYQGSGYFAPSSRISVQFQMRDQ